MFFDIDWKLNAYLKAVHKGDSARAILITMLKKKRRHNYRLQVLNLLICINVYPCMDKLSPTRNEVIFPIQN